MDAAPVVQAEGLTKVYRSTGGAIVALDSLSLTVDRGGVFGLLGPNGAGKSTFLRILCGLVRPTAGNLNLFGESPTPRTLGKLGALIETPRFPPYLTALEIMRYLARMSGADESSCHPLLDRVRLTHAADRRASSFSLGMKQRLGIAAALIGSPELLILDEPINGMDPEGIQEIRLLIRDLAERDGLTIILSSHLLDEVERTCDRVAILDRGQLRTQASLSDMLKGEPELRIEAQPIDLALDIAGANARLIGDAIVVSLDRAAGPALISALVDAQVQVFEARWQKQELEAVYFDRGEAL